MQPKVRTAVAAPRRWRRRKQARPAEIVDAALRLFAEKGFAATRLEDVARAAGVSKGTVYLYFASKEALFRAVVTEEVLPEVERAETMVAGYRGSMAALLRELVGEWWRVVGESPLSGIPKLMIAEAGNFPELARFYVDNVVRRVRQILINVITRGVEQGEFRHCNPVYVARALQAPLVFAVIWQRSLAPFEAQDYDPQTFLETQLALMLEGLCRDRQAAPN